MEDRLGRIKVLHYSKYGSQNNKENSLLFHLLKYSISFYNIATRYRNVVSLVQGEEPQLRVQIDIQKGVVVQLLHQRYQSLLDNVTKSISYSRKSDPSWSRKETVTHTWDLVALAQIEENDQPDGLEYVHATPRSPP